MAKAADLRAEDGVVARELRREVDVLRPAGDGVLFQAHLRDGESVDDINGAEGEVDLAARGEDELRADDVVCAVRVGGVEADGVALGGRYELVAGAAEGRVGAGVAEVPGELHAGDLDLQGVGRGSGVTLGGPERVGADSEQEEKRREGDEWNVLKRELMDWAVCAAVRDYADDKQNVREGEEAEGNPEIEEKVCVESAAVPGAVHGQVPEAKSWRDRLRGGHEVIVVCGES